MISAKNYLLENKTINAQRHDEKYMEKSSQTFPIKKSEYLKFYIYKQKNSIQVIILKSTVATLTTLSSISICP